MTRDEIYDHLAQVYLGKGKKAEIKEKKNRFNAWLLINILITVIIFSSAFYGLTAFFTHDDTRLQNSIMYSLHHGAVTMDYRFDEGYPPVKSFSLKVPQIDTSEYSSIDFSLRAREEGSPGIVKVVMKNKRKEEASFYIQGIDLKWQSFSIGFEEFNKITDFSTITDVTFVLESWNVDKKRGLIVIEDIGFSS
ncbi:MAG: hypothetical protein ACI9F2_001035 [Lysobacterales bacterium]|jgi:hypothetical protein